MKVSIPGTEGFALSKAADESSDEGALTDLGM